VCCVRLHLMLSAKALGMLVKSAHRIGKKRKKTSFAQINLMGFLNFAKMKETWTCEICFATMEKNHRSKQNSAETSNQVCPVLRSSRKNIKETRWQFSWKDPHFRGEYSQLFIHKLCAFLGYSNHKQIFLFKAFASITSAPP